MTSIALPSPLLAILFLGRKRPGFSPEWGEKMQEKVISLLKQEGHKFFVPPTRVVDDSTARHAIEECRTAKADVMVVLQPTMSDGRLAPIFGQLWRSPIVLWATPENPEGDMISACSLVGTHAFAATLRQLGMPFEVVYGNHNWQLAAQQLKNAVQLSYLEKSVKNAKLGLIGFHAPGFIDMYADPFLLNRTFGAQMQHMGLQEFLDTVNSQDEAAVANDIRTVYKLNLANKDTVAEDLQLSSKMYLALKQIVTQENFDAFALRCWPEIPNVLGQWPYLALSRMASEQVPLSIEGDIDAALGALFAKHLQLGPVYLSDWLEHDESHITIWHGGMSPFDIFEKASKPAKMAKHFNSKKPMVIDSEIEPHQNITRYRLWHCDGKYRLMAIEGNTEKTQRALMGTNGLAYISKHNVIELFEDLCHMGMPHHLSIVKGHHARTMKSVARRFGIEFVG
jgi:L-fucose isomerase-like protein